jgi:hypothetical protein
MARLTGKAPAMERYGAIQVSTLEPAPARLQSGPAVRGGVVAMAIGGGSCDRYIGMSAVSGTRNLNLKRCS